MKVFNRHGEQGESAEDGGSGHSRPAGSRWRRLPKARIAYALLVTFHVLGAISSVNALMSTRTSQGAIAWIISLNTFPYVAVPAYWILGRSKFAGYVIARQNEDHAVHDSTSYVAAELRAFVPDRADEYGRIQAAERLAKIPFLDGNHVELLIDGDATFESVFAGIEGAEEYILVQFFIVKNDDLGRELQTRLIEKARQGVRVLFLYDEIGSHKLPRSYLDAMTIGGVRVTSFHSTRGHRNRFQLNFRNHRKIVVVDGEEGWIGGHNVGDEYLGLDPKIGAWRDTHMKITGPAVLGLQLSFLEDWHWATDETPALPWVPHPSTEANVPILIAPTGPADSLETASLLFQHAIHSASRRIWIASPYFVPDEGVMSALQLASLRGVDVRVLIPDNPDHLLVYLSAFAFVGDMIDGGIEIYRYEPGFLHQKVMLVDDEVAAVGTVNLDNRSLRLNFEITAVVLDSAFASEVESMLIADFARARLMTREELDGKPLWFKVATRAAYLTAPIQ